MFCEWREGTTTAHFVTSKVPACALTSSIRVVYRIHLCSYYLFAATSYLLSCTCTVKCPSDSDVSHTHFRFPARQKPSRNSKMPSLGSRVLRINQSSMAYPTSSCWSTCSSLYSVLLLDNDAINLETASILTYFRSSSMFPQQNTWYCQDTK